MNICIENYLAEKNACEIYDPASYDVNNIKNKVIEIRHLVDNLAEICYITENEKNDMLTSLDVVSQMIYEFFELKKESY